MTKGSPCVSIKSSPQSPFTGQNAVVQPFFKRPEKAQLWLKLKYTGDTSFTMCSKQKEHPCKGWTSHSKTLTLPDHSTRPAKEVFQRSHNQNNRSNRLQSRLDWQLLWSSETTPGSLRGKQPRKTSVNNGGSRTGSLIFMPYWWQLKIQLLNHHVDPTLFRLPVHHPPFLQKGNSPKDPYIRWVDDNILENKLIVD
jgi:hypothetical protein